MIVDTDFSFIRLLENKEEAHDMGDSPAANIIYNGQVQLKPFSLTPFLQTTNVPGGISIEDYTLYIVDCDGNEFNATNSLHIAPFIDSDNIAQLSFELIYIEKDFGKDLVYFRIEQAAAQNWYSNKMLITHQDIAFTSRIDYIHNERYFGTDYPVLNFYQGIRLQFYYNNHVSKSSTKQYYQISTSQNVSLRANISQLNEYITQLFNGWSYKRLELALNSDQFYIDTVRNEPYESIEPDSRDENSNSSETAFLTDPKETDRYFAKFQIYQGLKAIDFEPNKGKNLVPSAGLALSQVDITFNQGINILPGFSGTLRKPDLTTIVLNTGNVSVLSNVLTINTTGVFDLLGNYLIQINNNSVSGVTYGEIWTGVFDWVITVKEADYTSVDYDSTDYLTD